VRHLHAGSEVSFELVDDFDEGEDKVDETAKDNKERCPDDIVFNWRHELIIKMMSSGLLLITVSHVFFCYVHFVFGKHSKVKAFDQQVGPKSMDSYQHPT